MPSPKKSQFDKTREIFSVLKYGELMKRLAPFLLCILLVTSCIHSSNQPLLVGNWKGTEWLIGGNPSEYDPKQVTFHFDKVGGYMSDFGGEKEKGTYILRKDKLFTTAENQAEIMVKISMLTKDS